ncbi:MAG: hypothetical protein WCQ72_01950 [Eubacteriales bacterium]
MLDQNKISHYNNTICTQLAAYITNTPDFITQDIINELCGECGIDLRTAFSFVLAAAIGLDTSDEAGHEIYEAYFPHMVRYLDDEIYINDPYYKNIVIPELLNDGWELKTERYKPYEAFVCGDLVKLSDGRIIPQIGFFEHEFRYPALLEGGREWMLITPNEINTMKRAVSAAHGRVLTFGLGLGYFAYMASIKPEVDSVVAVERDSRVIKLFRRYILPQFPAAAKIEIIESDAFDYAENKLSDCGADVVFTDLWHDPSDGVALRKHMRKYESRLPGANFLYWISDTLDCYGD